MITFATNFVSCSAVNENVWFVLGCRRVCWPTVAAYDEWKVRALAYETV